MFAQFRTRYPTGGLISELLTIYQAKYVVRAVVQIDGVILATGLAAADTVELAEDQAKKRAILALGMESLTTLPPLTIPGEPSKSIGIGVAEALEPIQPEVPSVAFNPPILEEPSVTSTNATVASEVSSSTSEDWLATTYINPKPGKQKAAQDTPLSTTAKGKTASLPPIFPATGDYVEGVPPYGEEPDVSSPAPVVSRPVETTDFSSDIAKTDIQLKRLGWTPEQGAAYLQKTYGKRSRRLLTDAELLDFLHYLESLPTPSGIEP